MLALLTLLMKALPVPPPFASVTVVGAFGATTSFVLVVELVALLPAWSVALALAVIVPSLRVVRLLALKLIVPAPLVPEALEGVTVCAFPASAIERLIVSAVTEPEPRVTE